MSRTYIEIPSWDGPEGFQHYRDRDPIWIKNYTRLLSKDEYLALSGHRRAILHGLWLAYATSHRRLPDDTLTLTRRLSLKVSTADLKALREAGFIRLGASEPIAPSYQDASPHARPRGRGEVEVEVETPQTPLSVNSNNKSKPTCHICGIQHTTPAKLDDHLRNVHDVEIAIPF